MAFEFLNGDDDSLPGSAPGPSQAYQSGTQDSFDKKSSEFGMRPQTPEEPDAKKQYVKAKTTVEGAYGNAQKILTRLPNGQFPTGEPDNTWSNIDHQSRNDVDVLLQRVQNREHPLKIADDMRAIAGRSTVPQGYQEMLHKGADQMQDAYGAQATLDDMNKPGGALALGSDELENRYGSAQADIGNINQQIDQKQEQLKTTGYLNAPKVQQELQQLYNQKKQAEQTIAQAGGGGIGNREQLDKKVDLNAVATAAGVPRREILQANTELRRMVQAHGVSITAAVTPMTFPIVLTNLVTSFFNQQKASQLLSEMLPEKKPAAAEGPPGAGGQPSDEGQPRKPDRNDLPPSRGAYGGNGFEQDPRFQNVSNQIQQREARRDQIWQELRNSHTFNNVGDVLGFIVCSVLIGAQNAAHIFTNMDKVGNLRWELDKLDHETTNLYHQQDSYIQLSQHARSQAAAEQHEHNIETEMSAHHWMMEKYAKMNRAPSSGFSPEDKAMDKAFKASMRQRFDALQKIKQEAEMAAKTFDFKTAKAKQKEYFDENQKYHDWVKTTITPWYDKRGVDLTTPGGTGLDEKTFQ